jgi:type IV secretory pathway VirB9-like protein
MNYPRVVVIVALLTVPVATAHTQTPGVREVVMSERSVVPVATRIRYFTDIVFPQDEEILEPHCGDRDFWIVEVAGNVVRIKPAKEGASTNLDVRMSNNRIYTFELTEGKKPADVKVFVARDPAIPQAAAKFRPASEVETLESQVAQLRVGLEAERRRADETISKERERFPGRLVFAYRTPEYEKPFWVRAIWHDGNFTYLRADARELPALYELVDGRPALVNFTVNDGLYVVQKVLDRGYLAIGKRRWTFERRDHD